MTRRTTALVLGPLAAASGVWILAMAGGIGSADGRHGPGDLPQVPAEAIEVPASLPVAGVIAPGVPAGTADTVVKSASTSGIPAPALSAYQRAAEILGKADKSCRIGWELIAAIGRVESDHGRYGGSVLTDEGVSKPGILGIPLNGKGGTQAIKDTDGGQLDQDPVFDRAVGPMQFIPGTWNVVKVDADNDGQRNPQDIDDAALATGVYLCSGNEDLSADAGQEKAIFRYNHSHEYVALVMKIAAAYAAGDYATMPSAVGGGTFGPRSSSDIDRAREAARERIKDRKPRGNGGGNGGGKVGSGSSDPGSVTDPSPRALTKSEKCLQDQGLAIGTDPDTLTGAARSSYLGCLGA